MCNTREGRNKIKEHRNGDAHFEDIVAFRVVPVNSLIGVDAGGGVKIEDITDKLLIRDKSPLAFMGTEFHGRFENMNTNPSNYFVVGVFQTERAGILWFPNDSRYIF